MKNWDFVFNQIDSQGKESYYALLANLKLSEGPPKILLITSPGPTESKTMLVINLGITFAQTGAKVLLVDADLRQPKLHKFCRLPNTEGFGEVLTAGADFQSVLRSFDPGPKVITSGSVVSEELKLNGFQNAGKFVKKAASDYDLVLIDFSPVLTAGEMLSLASLVDGVILTLPLGDVLERDAKQAKVLLEKIKGKLLGVVLANTTGSLREEAVGGHGYQKRLFRFVKRAADVLFSIAILILALPLMLIIAFLARLSSPGPVIFKQVRIGTNHRTGERRRNNQKNYPFERRKGERRKVDLGGKPFTFYKFRTMFHNAKELYPESYTYDYTPEEIKTMYFKGEDDPRHTSFGRKLRKTSLDELPNFINVLKGDMSVVGPRPEIPEMIKYYDDWQKVKFEVKPGVTGPSQINGRGRLTFQETLARDVKYSKNQSLFSDIKIILGTVKALLSRLGAF